MTSEKYVTDISKRLFNLIKSQRCHSPLVKEIFHAYFVLQQIVVLLTTINNTFLRLIMTGIVYTLY